MQQIINRLLLLIIAALIIVLAYRILSKSTTVSVPIATTTINEAEVPTLSREEIEATIKNYLMNNPEVIISAIEKLQKQKIAQIAEKAKNYLEEQHDSIEETTNSPILGNADGKSIIVVFYDYNCSFCKKGDRNINVLIEKHNDLKVIMRPFPVLGENSLYLAKLAMAVYKITPDKFPIIHKELIATSNPSQEVIYRILQDHDINIEVIEQEINKKEMQDAINANFELANNLAIRGAPAYIINGKLIPGLISPEEFERILRQGASQESSAKDN